MVVKKPYSRANEQRQPYVAVLFESHANGVTDADVRGRAFDDIGRQPHRRTVIETDDGNYIRNRKTW
jgi:hypothetical protein